MSTTILFTLPNLSTDHSKLPRILAISNALDRKYFQPIVSVDHVGRLNSDGLKLLEEAQIPVQVMRMTLHKHNIGHSLVQMSKTPIMLKKTKVAIQHSSDYSKWWTEPLLAHLGGVQHWITTKTNMDVKGIHWYIRMKFAKKIIVQSPQLLTHLSIQFPNFKHKLVLIPNGVDTYRFKPRKRDEKLANDLGLDPNKLVLGCVAHLVPVKDHPSLIHAISRLKYLDIELLLIGADVNEHYAKQVKYLVKELELTKQVHFLSKRSDISQLHSIMDGLVLISKGESASNAVLEGMASGLPIICSDVGGLPDAVQSHINGWVVSRGEDFVDKIAESIDDWATHPEKRESYGVASRQIIEEHFSLSKMVHGHIQLYQSLIEESI